MGKRTLILSQSQLNEILDGDTSYLDNLENDFAEDGSNEIYVGEKMDGEDSIPLTTDRHAKERCLDYGYFSPGGRSGSGNRIVYGGGMITCSKKEWEDRNIIREENQDITNNTYGDNKNRVSNTNASTLKWRYGAAKKKAQSTDPVEKKQGLSTMKTMEKNNPNIKEIETQYNAAMANDANIKKSKMERGEQNVYQKPGGTKNSGNGGSKTPKNEPIITYEY